MVCSFVRSGKIDILFAERKIGAPVLQGNAVDHDPAAKPHVIRLDHRHHISILVGSA